MKASVPTTRTPAVASAAALEAAAGYGALPRLHVLSDVHLETGNYELPADLDFDILVAAGDIGPVELSVPWLAKVGKPVVYVLGNHEHWGTDFGAALKAARQLARGTQVHVLERQSVVLQGVRFFGATFWPDFGDWHRDLVMQALKYSRDFGKIRAETWWSRKSNATLAQRQAKRAGFRHSEEGRFSPVIAYAEHCKSLAWLKEQLAPRWHGPTVVVSHHAPSRECLLAAGVDERYLRQDYWDSREREAGKVASYASPLLDEKLDRERATIALWAHGHLHHAIDLAVGSTRVVANPRGYASRPLTMDDIKLSGFFGPALTEEDVRRSEAAHAAAPYAGDGRNFDAVRVFRFGDGLRDPLAASLAPKLELLDALIVENEELLPLVHKGHDLATRCVERVFAENCDRFASQVRAIQAKEGRAVDANSFSLVLARFRPPPAMPMHPVRFFGPLTRKAYADQLNLMRTWRAWIAALPRAAELGVRAWVVQGIKGLGWLHAAGIEAAVFLPGFESLRRLSQRDLEFHVTDESAHEAARRLLEDKFNGGRGPREVLFSVRKGSLWGETEAKTAAQLRALERALKR